jgi:hypothetical protein
MIKFKSNYKNEYTLILKELLQECELIEIDKGVFIPCHEEDGKNNNKSKITLDW